jgi:hypothetical protein
MLKNLFLFSFPLLTVFYGSSNAQNASEKSSNLIENTESLRDPVKFTHVPVFLLRLSPQHAFRYDNMRVGGIELAPPVGKFSFVFDYGKGKGYQSFNKKMRQEFFNNETKMLRGEIRTYFSDWYPFYALDKKPFGRYYAIEFQQIDSKRYVSDDLSEFINPDQKRYFYNELRRDIRLKLGKHIHFHKHFFLDLNAGLGVGFYKNSEPEDMPYNGSSKFLTPKFFSKNRVHGPEYKKGVAFSSTLNLNLVFPL